MKIQKRGYRLTPEEEAMLRGEPRDRDLPTDRSGNNDPRNEEPKQAIGMKKVLRMLLPLLLFLTLMIGVAYFFFYLAAGNNGNKASPSAETDSLFLSVTRKYETYRFPPLSEEERLLFVRKLSLTPEQEDLFWPEYYRFADRAARAEAIHNEWIRLLAEGNYQITLPERIMQQYDSFYKTHKNLTESYMQTFSEFLSRDRAAWIFILHDEIRQQRNSRTP